MKEYITVYYHTDNHNFYIEEFTHTEYSKTHTTYSFKRKVFGEKKDLADYLIENGYKEIDYYSVNPEDNYAERFMKEIDLTNEEEVKEWVEADPYDEVEEYVSYF